MSRFQAFFLMVFSVLALSACDKTDQIDRPGTWKLPPTGQGANDSNLRAMIANPNDLIAGQDSPGSLGVEAVPPVDLLYAGQRRQLPAVSTTSLSGGTTNQTPFGGNLGGGLGGSSAGGGGGSSGGGSWGGGPGGGGSGGGGREYGTRYE
jgi:hypothetical protein